MSTFRDGGCGKGSKPVPFDKDKMDENYEKIKWDAKPLEHVKEVVKKGAKTTYKF